MKKLLALTCTMLLALCLVGCTASNGDVNSANDDGVVSDDTQNQEDSSGNIISDSVSMIESMVSDMTGNDTSSAK